MYVFFCQNYFEKSLSVKKKINKNTMKKGASLDYDAPFGFICLSNPTSSESS